MSRILLLITKIHHVGSNILGLLMFGVLIITLLMGIRFVDSGMHLVGIAFFVFGMATVAGVDFLWRYGSDPRDSVGRFVFPGCGGCVCLIPIWLYVSLAVAGLGIAFSILASNKGWQ
ncbi:MAG TPA: hypothetical protein VMP01_00215 [Pirellulaceae bacterium]|nr:hypothetical protein [Pirellulaceae bacterium]